MMALDLDQHFDASSGRAPGREKGHIPVGDVAADQQAARPQARSRVVVFGGVEIGLFAIDPIVQSRVPFVPSPADWRCHADGSSVRAISSAVPARWGLPYHDPK
jgi:hypothetical protein